MDAPLFFFDPFGNTCLSGRKTLLFCAFHGFTIPHDIAGAILYSEVFEEAKKVDFGTVLDMFIPSLRSFVDTSLFLPALADMGYQDLVDEFNCLDEKMREFMEVRFSSEPYNIQAVVNKLEEMLPKYSVPYFPHVKDAHISWISDIHSERIVVHVSSWEGEGDHAGVLSLSGDVVLPPIYKNIWTFEGRYYIVQANDDSQRFWDAEQNIFLQFRCKVFRAIFGGIYLLSADDHQLVIFSSSGPLLNNRAGLIRIPVSIAALSLFGSELRMGHGIIPAIQMVIGERGLQ